MIIDCDRCNVRGLACANCAVTFIVAQRAAPQAPQAARHTGQPSRTGQAAEVELDAADVRALAVLASAGLIPPLRYAPAMAKAS
jgi:hypothetical protein